MKGVMMIGVRLLRAMLLLPITMRLPRTQTMMRKRDDDAVTNDNVTSATALVMAVVLTVAAVPSLR